MNGSQGIHNVFIVIPQFLVTILCAIVFAVFDSDVAAVPAVDNAALPAVLERAADSDRPNSVVYIFRCVALPPIIYFNVRVDADELLDWERSGRSSRS